jgi:hypothetical protein
VHGLRDTITLLAAHPSRGRRLAQAGTAAVGSVTWPAVAAATAAVYTHSDLGPRELALPEMEDMVMIAP